MLLLVHINLKDANLGFFDAYEAAVLPLLAHHKAKLEFRLRAVDGSSETHLLRFPDAAALERFQHDSARIAAQPLWDRSGATSTITEVTHAG